MFNLGLPTFDIPGLSFLEETANAYLGESGLGLDKDEEGSGPVAAAGGVEVHFLDVGQAQSVFIRGPKKTALIDAGENNQGGDVLQYLEKQGVTKLDYVIGTHPHSDHIGGLDTVIAGMEVGAVILPEIPGEIVPATVTYTDLLEAIDAKGLRITQAVPGKTYSLAAGPRWRCWRRWRSTPISTTCRCVPGWTTAKRPSFSPVTPRRKRKQLCWSGTQGLRRMCWTRGTTAAARPPARRFWTPCRPPWPLSPAASTTPTGTPTGR